jgi:hypothetical protein
MLVSPTLNPQVGGQPIVVCPRLRIRYIRSWRPSLHPQPEDVAGCDRHRPSLFKVNRRFCIFVDPFILQILLRLPFELKVGGYVFSWNLCKNSNMLHDIVSEMLEVVIISAGRNSDPT